ALVHGIEDDARSRQDDARREDGALPDADAFVDPGSPAHEDLVLDDDGDRAYGLEDAAPLRRGREVDFLPDLRAGADERMAVDHRALVDVRAHVHVGGRHHDDALREKRAAAKSRPARDDAHAFGKRPARREGVAVAEEERAGFTRFLDAEPKGREDALLDSRVRHPVSVRVGGSRANLAALERPEKCDDLLARHAAAFSTGFPAASRRPALRSASSGGAWGCGESGTGGGRGGAAGGGGGAGAGAAGGGGAGPPRGGGAAPAPISRGSDFIRGNSPS